MIGYGRDNENWVSIIDSRQDYGKLGRARHQHKRDICYLSYIPDAAGEVNTPDRESGQFKE